MRSSFLLLFVTLFVTTILFAQTYNNPESVVYDVANDRYLVSNKGNGDIISIPRNNPNNLSFFNTGTATSIRGIIIVNNTLWCSSTHSNGTSQVLYNFDLTTGNYIKEILIGGGNFINDVTADGGVFIYVSDNNNIYKVNITDDSFSTILANAGANGLLYDGVNNRLLFTDDRPINGSAISAYRFNNK